MKKSSKVESNDHARNLSLIHQFKSLEEQWKSLQNPKPRTSSTTSHSTTTTISFDHLFHNSPRDLMFSLQNPPSDHRIFRPKPHNMAVEEILRDRRAAIVSGKLKARRLFAAEESDMNYGSGEVCSDWLNNEIEEREVKLPVDFDLSCSFSDSSPSEEKVVVVEENTFVEVAEKGGGDGRGCGGGGGWRVVPLAWFAVVLMVIALGFVSMTCNGKYVEKTELILVPT